MKGILLAGGTGSRLHPLTKVTNKHLLPIGEKPMIYYPLATLRDAGLSEILIVTGGEHLGDIAGLLESGIEQRVSLTYKVQEEAGGIAQALGLAEEFSNKENIAVILGDNIFQDTFNFSDFRSGARIFIKKVQDPQRFGVAEIDGQKVTRIEEKPVNPKTNHAVTGLYLYDDSVFDIIRTLKPSSRKELEITDVNNHYINEDKMESCFVNGYWTDAGTFETLNRANKLVWGSQSS